MLAIDHLRRLKQDSKVFYGVHLLTTIHQPLAVLADGWLPNINSLLLFGAMLLSPNTTCVLVIFSPRFKALLLIC